MADILARRREWLDSLKPGDEVGYYSRGLPILTAVLKRTRMRITLDGGAVFNADGKEKLKKGQRYGAVLFVADEVRRSIASNRLRHVDWIHLPLATLQQVVALVEQSTPPATGPAGEE